MTNELKLRIIVGESKTLGERYLDDLTSDLEAELLEEKLDVEPERTESSEGAYGDPITVGSLVVAAISGGLVTAVFNRITKWLDRNKISSVEVEIIKGPTGEVISERVKVTQSGVKPEDEKKIIDKVLKEQK